MKHKLFWAIFDLTSQILNSYVVRLLLYTTCIIKKVSVTGKYGYNHLRPVKTGCCSRIATKAQRRANNPVGYTPVFPQQTAHRATHGDTRRNRAFLARSIVFHYYLLLLVSAKTTFKYLSKLAAAHKSRQTSNTAQTNWSGTFPTFLNKSHTGRYTAKQGSNLAVHTDMP